MPACAFGDKTAAIAPVYPQGGGNPLVWIYFVNSRTKGRAQGLLLFVQNKLFFFFKKFWVFNCRHRSLTGIGWPSLCWRSCPNPWRLMWEGRISFTVVPMCENIDARVWRSPAAPHCGAAPLPTGIKHRGDVWALEFSAHSASTSFVHNTNENNIITEE